MGSMNPGTAGSGTEQSGLALDPREVLSPACKVLCK